MPAPPPQFAPSVQSIREVVLDLRRAPSTTARLTCGVRVSADRPCKDAARPTFDQSDETGDETAEVNAFEVKTNSFTSCLFRRAERLRLWRIDAPTGFAFETLRGAVRVTGFPLSLC